MRVRRLLARDAEAFRDLRLTALRTVPQAFGSDFAEAQKRPLDRFIQRIEDGKILAAEAEGALVGCLAFDRITGAKLAHRGSITSVFVLPEWRRRGVARALVDAAIAEAEGLDQLELFVSDGVPGARAFYEELGFVCVGSIPNALKVGDARYAEDLMVLSLRAQDI